MSFEKRAAFTMIELIFVIVILGILAGVAVPKFFGTVEDAYLSKAQSQVASIRTGLKNYRSKELLRGNGANYPVSLDGTKLFDVVSDGVSSGTGVGEWSKNVDNQYEFHLDGDQKVVFEYNSTLGTFECLANLTSDSFCNRFD